MLTPELTRKLLDSAPDAVVVVDTSGRIVYVNRQLETHFGYQPEELIDGPIERLLPERFRSGHIARRQGYVHQARLRPMGTGLDLFARRRDGSEFPVEISLSPIASGQDVLVAAAIRDVSDRKQIQVELQKAREAAEDANRAKSRFLATASHDLRQPLQALSLLNGAMLRSVHDPTVIESLAEQQQAIDAMARLLNALLDISKLESGAIEPEITDFTVSALLDALRSEFTQLAAEKGLQFRIESGADRVRSDPSLIGQILRNLIANAIKYTRQGQVTMRCERDGASVRLEVVDTGIGIPHQDVARIFDEFYQVGVPVNTSRQGYGLGLSIVRRIIDLLGLQIEVQSEVGRGSTFSLWLPPGAAAEPSVAAKPKEAAALQRAGLHRSVLYVEDDMAVRRATGMLLRVAGYEAIVAGSVAEAAQQARDRPDVRLLITDYHLGSGETGLHVLAAVRGVLGQELKVILITGDTSSAVRALQSDRHLRIASKPIDAEQFLSLIAELIDAGAASEAAS